MGTDGHSIEREFKLAVDPGFELPDLRGMVGETLRLPELHTVAVYFDTADFRLWRRGITLRHRTGEGPGPGLWTLKLPIDDTAPTLDRTELSWPGGRGPVPKEAERFIRGVVRWAPLVEVAELRATRRRLVLRDDQGETCGEIDDDTVTVAHDGGKRRRFRQVELEVMGRGDAVGGKVVDALVRAGARTERTPKLGKALEMTGRTPEATGPPMLHRRSSMSDVVRASIGTALDRLLAHDIGLRLRAGDPVAHDVHQARVATRRLRSDLKLLSVALDPAWVAHTRAELKWLGAVLGDVRDADVLAGSLFTAASVAEAGGTIELRVGLDEARRTAARELATALEDDRYLHLLDRLDTASAEPPLSGGDRTRRKKRKKKDRRRGKDTSAPARRVLPSLVRRQLRVLRRAVRSAGDHPSDTQLHKIRIRAKQLRYAGETAAPVLGKAARRVASGAEELQTVLGEHHDSVTAEQWLRHQALGGTRSAAFSAGVLVAGERRKQRKLRRTWRPVWARLDRKAVRRSLS